MLKFKNFFVQHFAAFMIGILILSVGLITKGMIDSIKRDIDKINLIKYDENYPDNIPVAATGKEYLEEYTVKEYDGRIGIYLKGDTVPTKVVQIYVEHLPERDKVKLRRGITVFGRISLENMLEELGS